MALSVIHFETLGCKLNQIETESVARYFSDAGFIPDLKPFASSRPPAEQPLLGVLNTCTVTGKAEQKARRTIRLFLNSCPEAPLIVTGCYAQVEQDFLRSIDSRVFVLPGTCKDALAELPALLASLGFAAGNAKKSLCAVLSSWAPLLPNTKYRPVNAFALSTDSFMRHSRGSVKIQDGCSNRCAYCRIRLARGEPVSLEPFAVLERVHDIERTGQPEVMLTGVNLSLYRGLPGTQNGAEENPASNGHGTPALDFAGLLAFLTERTERVSFRISSLYPQSVTAQLCAAAAHKRVRPHFHLSVQSGSDAVLGRMRRSYTVSDVYAAVKNLRAIKENPFIACDIIAGFPGETDADFEQTLTLCRDCNFAWIHVFPFSARPGTEAASMQDQIPAKIASERVKQITALALAAKERYVRSCEGSVFKGVIEKHRATHIRAVTENFLHVRVAGNQEQLRACEGREILLKICEAIPLAGVEGEIEAEAVPVDFC